MATLPPVPSQLKAIQHYLKTATEHDKRDPVIAYYCRLFALQNGMEIDKKDPDCRKFHVSLMDYLERVKKELADEAIHNEVVGQAHVESYALKVFLFADNEDRAGRFNKNVVKSFYTAGMLFDTLSVFGELSEDLEKNKKYAKWKAAYIHKCLKSGETPVAGPLPEEGDEASGGAPQPGAIGFEPQPGFSGFQSGYTSSSSGSQPSSYSGGYQPGPSPSNQSSQSLSPDAYPGAKAPPTTPQDSANAVIPPVVLNEWKPPQNPAGLKLGTAEYQKAMKYCKYASSALQYEDSKTAIDNLTKALTLLTTGKDS